MDNQEDKKTVTELKIVTIEQLLQEDLSIPQYQRPYCWSTDSAATLFVDVKTAYEKKLPEYRIGSVILHKEKNELNIVDGQQRITTLIILLFSIDKRLAELRENDSSAKLDKKSFALKIPLLKKDELFNNLSSKAILNNYEVFITKCKDLDEKTLEEYESYLLKKCTFVKIVIKEIQEAFQFFDSQNSRGKELAPHDLLKSYHLREMKYDDEISKVNIINNWESTDQKDLKYFFESTLYPLVRWYKGRDGLKYSSRKINIFKGIKQSNSYNFSIYHKAANLYIEHFNQEKMYELNDGEQPNQFQLTQPIIAGKRFFQFTLHYYNLYQIISDLVEETVKKYEIDFLGTGNKYIKRLFTNVCLFFADKFNIPSLTDSRIKRLCYWAYSLRIVMHAIYLETINNYALGINDRLNFGLNLFKEINDMQSPEELDLISLRKVSIEEMTTYDTKNHEAIFNALMEMSK